MPRVYIATYPTSPESSLVRLFLMSSCDKEKYKTYLETIGVPHVGKHCSTFQHLEYMPAHVTRESLLPNSRPGACVIDGIPYDFEATKEQLNEYIQFVKTTGMLEQQRPKFDLPMPTKRSISIEEENWMANSEEIPSDGEEPQGDNVCILELHTDKDCSAIYPIWAEVTKMPHMRFYVKTTPHVVSFQNKLPWSILMETHRSWFTARSICPYETTEDIQTWIRETRLENARHTYYKLANGKVLEEKKERWSDFTWKEMMCVLGGPMVLETLHILASSVLLINTEGEVLLPLPIEVERLNKEVLKDFQVEDGILRLVLDGFKAVETKEIPPTQTEEPTAMDDTECMWEQLKEEAKADQKPTDKRKQLRALLQEFRTPPLLTMGEKEEAAAFDALPIAWNDTSVYAYGFLVFLLKKYEADRSTEMADLITYFKDTGMDMMNVKIPSTACLIPLLDNSVVKRVAAVDPKRSLEVRICLAMYRHPLAYKWSDNKSLLFRYAVQTFQMAHCGPSRYSLAASTLWAHWIAFLRTHDLEFAGMFGNQAEFNDVMRDLGWEQKRQASGKVWMNMTYVEASKL
jgi:hypothetical protein